MSVTIFINPVVSLRPLRSALKVSAIFGSSIKLNSFNSTLFVMTQCRSADKISPIAGDVHKAAAQIKGQLPGRGVDAEKEAKKYGQEAGAKIDSAVSAVYLITP